MRWILRSRDKKIGFSGEKHGFSKAPSSAFYYLKLHFKKKQYPAHLPCLAIGPADYPDLARLLCLAIGPADCPDLARLLCLAIGPADFLGLAGLGNCACTPLPP